MSLLLERDVSTKKLSKRNYMEQAYETLLALKKLGATLSQAEKQLYKEVRDALNVTVILIPTS